MTATPSASPLAALESFLQQDPGNDALRADAFETALRIGLKDRAEFHLRHALAAGANPLVWRLNKVHWQMAEARWQEAWATLGALLDEENAPPGWKASVMHDTAYVALRIGEFERGAQVLAPLAAGEAAPPPQVQALWLRLLHQATRLDEAMAFAVQWARAGQLGAEAAGVASLVAFDANELAPCLGWAEQALASQPRHTEALLCRAGLWLLARDAEQATALLRMVLEAHPQSGRTLSMLGFAQMLAGDLASARSTFQQALVFMPGHIGTWHGLGWAEFFLGDLPAARKAFEHALALDRNFAESHGGLAVVQAKLGEREAAQAGVAVALRLDRACMSAHYARAILEGQAEDAEEIQRLAIRLLGMQARGPRP